MRAKTPAPMEHKMADASHQSSAQDADRSADEGEAVKPVSYPDFTDAEIEEALRPYGPAFVASMQASHPGISRKAIVQQLWAAGELG